MREKLIKLWPLAFCIAVSLSCSLGSQSGESRDRQSSDPDSRARSSDDEASELAGTTWKGTFKCDDGDELQANYRFADSGNPIYEYQTRGGAREVELTEAGQTLRFVPPGGGVTNIVIDSIDVSPRTHQSHADYFPRECQRRDFGPKQFDYSFRSRAVRFGTGSRDHHSFARHSKSAGNYGTRRSVNNYLPRKTAALSPREYRHSC